MSDFTKKTIIGIISAILAMLVLFGVLTPEQSDTVSQAITPLIEHIGAAILAIFSIWGIFTGSKAKE